MSSPARTSRLSRRAVIAGGIALSGAMLTGTPLSARQQSATPASPPAIDPAGEIVAIAERAMAEKGVRAVLLRVTIDGDEVLTHAMGESMTGVRATTDMHVRNGAVAISYVSTVLLRLVDDGTVGLDDTIDTWLPDLPDAGAVTLRMLANMTAGYRDHVRYPGFDVMQYADPFQQWTTDDMIALSLDQPRLFAPGENWEYSHSNYVILGLALEAASGEPMEALMRQHVLDPLGLTGTGAEQTGWMPEPVLHAYTSERRGFLGIPAGVPFIEESTFWDPSWTLTRGAVQYSTVTDMADSMAAIARGDLLSPESHEAQVGDTMIGFGAPLEGCDTCHTLDEVYSYGLGIVRSGGWLLQNPLFAGFGGTAGYHADGRIAVAVVTTFGEDSFEEDGAYRYGNASQAIFHDIGELLMPSDPPLLGG